LKNIRNLKTIKSKFLSEKELGILLTKALKKDRNPFEKALKKDRNPFKRP